jgi:hypothetical protein
VAVGVWLWWEVLHPFTLPCYGGVDLVDLDYQEEVEDIDFLLLPPDVNDRISRPLHTLIEGTGYFFHVIKISNTNTRHK